MDKVLPHNINSEKIVIGSILSDVNAFSEVSPILNPDMFYDKFHAELYTAIIELTNAGKAPDIVMLSERYIKSHNAILKIADIGGCFSVDYYDHALNIQEKYVRRKMWFISQQVSADIFSTKDTGQLLADMQRNLSDITQSVSDSSITTIQDAVKGVYRQIETNLKGGSSITGTDTGFKEINKAAGGFQKSDLIIIAGETSQGKTSLALSIIDKSAKAGDGIAIYSMEMKKEQLAARLLAMNCGVPSNQILFSRLDENYLQIVETGVSKIYDLPIFFDDRSTSNIDKIIASIRSMKTKHDISGAAIDYLQILNVNQKSQNKEQAMADVSRRLKNLAKELDIWIIALSQLNRDMSNPVPNLNRLRDSGQIAEAADMVIFVYRPEVYGKFFPEPFTNHTVQGFALIDIAKGRNIGQMKFVCAFDKKTTSFSDIDEIVTMQPEESMPF